MPPNEVFTQRRAAYVAGYFDARGCISVSLSRCLVQLVVGSKEPKTLAWLVDDWGGRIYQTSASRNRLAALRPYFEWRLTARRDVLEFLQAIRPYVVLKAERADEALGLLRGAVAA